MPRCGKEAADFEFQGSGQVKIGHGNFCLSQCGAAAGLYNVALRAAASASSTADVSMHGAGMAVDGRATFWASRLAPVSSEELLVDFGSPAKLQTAEITWEHPAKSFAVFVSEQGTHWVEAFATDINVLNTTRVQLGHRFATKAKVGSLARSAAVCGTHCFCAFCQVVMYEPHPVYAKLHGRSLYGIQSLSFAAARSQTGVEDCTQAEKSTDARDKYFLVAAGNYDAYPSKGLRSELPAFDAARTSLAAVTTSLSAVLPQLSSCQQMHGPLIASRAADHPSKQREAQVSNASGSIGEAAAWSFRPLSLPLPVLTAGARGGSSEVEEQNGIDLESAKLLLSEARAAILQVRAVLM
jgi:hypothetical protein